MPHRLILHLAIGLSVFLVLVALAFAWSARLHDASLPARLDAATAADTPGAAGSAPPRPDGSVTPPSGVETFEKRCARCHDPEEVTAWTSKQSGDRCAALEERLREHRKAPEPENRVIASLFAPGCAGESAAGQAH